jgi:NADH-quinone oxidoreductase subunit M
LRGDDEAAAVMPNELWPPPMTFVVSVVHSDRFNLQDRVPVCRRTHMDHGAEPKWALTGFRSCFVMLTTFLMPIVIASCWSVNTRVRIHDRVLVAGNADARRVHGADLVLFYLFFEAGLIPMFLIIGIWGGANRVYASFTSSFIPSSGRY